MLNKEIEEFVELLYPYFLKKMIKENAFKNCVKRKNATVASGLADGETNIGLSIDVVLPYDSVSFSVRNETGVDLNSGDLVCLEYSNDLKNAVAVYKV